MHKRLLAGLATAGIIGGGVYGFAATLGVTSDDLAAGSDAVNACDTAVTVNYTVVYDATLPGYKVDDVQVAGIDSVQCLNQEIQVTLTGAANADLADHTGVVDAATETFDFSGDDTLAADVTGVHVAIDGVDVP